MTRPLPPCCADLDEPPCAQHRQAARVHRHAGLRAKGGHRGPVVGQSGKAKPAAEPEAEPEAER